MNAPFFPESPVRHVARVCPFCNEALAELWRDPMRPEMDHQVRCEMCDARGPWSSADGAVDAWEGVIPTPTDVS